MNEIDVSANELQLRKLDKRDKAFRVIQVIVLSIVVAITMFELLSVRTLTQENRTNIDEHRSQIENASSDINHQLIVTSNINRAKLDIGLCIFSVSPTKRTPEYVKFCYDTIEQSSGIKVERFGDGL